MLSSLTSFKLKTNCLRNRNCQKKASLRGTGLRISVLLLAENALLNHSGEASDNLIIFMGTLHRGNGANNDTFNKVGGVSQWQNSPIKKHRIYYNITFRLQYMAIWCQILSSPTALLYIYISQLRRGARLGCIC